MYATLTEYARAVYGDEYRPEAGPGAREQERYFIETLTFAEADAIVDMLHTLSPHMVDGYLPVWVRNLAYRLILLQRPDDPALMREAAENLWLHGPDWDDIAKDLEARANTLDPPA